MNTSGMEKIPRIRIILTIETGCHMPRMMSTAMKDG